MARVRPTPRVVSPDDRAAGAAPAIRCGRATRSCTCGPRGNDRHHRSEHAGGRGACSRPGCTCQAFDPYPCLKPRKAGRATCRSHGGASLVGSANPNFRHGGRSKYMQSLHGAMLARYQDAVGDPELLNLSAELALTEARIHDVLGRLTSSTSASYDDLADAFDAFEAVVAGADARATKSAAARVRQLLKSGKDAAGLRGELDTQIDLKRRLAEGQARILRDSYQTVALSRVLEIIAQVADIVRRNVTDAKQVSAVVADLARLLGPGIDSAATTGRPVVDLDGSGGR